MDNTPRVGVGKAGWIDASAQQALAAKSIAGIAAILGQTDVTRRFVPNEEKVAFEERYNDGYHTIWECYAPEEPTPATRWDNTFYGRQDFVGWSGLGPIAMLIEQVIGIDVVGSENRIQWDVTRSDRHGIERLRLRDQEVSLICEPEDTGLQVSILCEHSFEPCLVWGGERTIVQIPAGEHTFSIEG